MSNTDNSDILPSVQPGSGKVAQLVNRLSSVSSSMSAQPQTKKFSHEKVQPSRVAYVRFSYVAAQDDELNLLENDVVEVLEDVEDGWAKGRLNGRTGLFPTNFVTFSTTPANNSATYSNAPVSRNSDSSHTSVTKKPSSSSRDESFSSPLKAKTPLGNPQNANANSHVIAGVRHSSSSTRRTDGEPSSKSLNSSHEVAKVLYEYVGANPDELDLKEGEIVNILNRKTQDEGWYLGEIDGRTGLFPENFVRIINSTNPEGRPSIQGTNIQPPSLPAKPAKPYLNRNSTIIGTNDASSVQQTPTTTEHSSQSASPVTGERTRDTIPHRGHSDRSSPPPTRTSMIAGLQSKLFPQPAFTPTGGALASSVHGSLSSTSSLKDEREDENQASHVPSRSSAIDPTVFGQAQFVGNVESEEEKAVDESTKHLESLTKFRPKMPGKRPPSTQFRASKLTLPVDAEAEPTVGTVPTTAAVSSQSSTETTPLAISAGPTTTFPAQNLVKDEKLSSPSHTKAEVAGIAKDLANVVSLVNSKPPASKSTRATVTPTSEHVSPVEFEKFRMEVLRRLDHLEKQVAHMLNATSV